MVANCKLVAILKQEAERIWLQRMREANTVPELASYTHAGPKVLAKLYNLLEKVNCNDYYELNMICNFVFNLGSKRVEGQN